MKKKKDPKAQPSHPRLPSKPYIIMIPFFLLFCSNKEMGPPNKKGKRVLLGYLASSILIITVINVRLFRTLLLQLL